MSLSTVLILFLAHLGVGIVFTLVFVSREAGVKFFRFNAGLAAILLMTALAFRYGAPGPSDLAPTPRSLGSSICWPNIPTCSGSCRPRLTLTRQHRRLLPRPAALHHNRSVRSHRR